MPRAPGIDDAGRLEPGEELRRGEDGLFELPEDPFPPQAHRMPPAVPPRPPPGHRRPSASCRAWGRSPPARPGPGPAGSAPARLWTASAMRRPEKNRAAMFPEFPRADRRSSRMIFSRPRAIRRRGERLTTRFRPVSPSATGKTLISSRRSAQAVTRSTPAIKGLCKRRLHFRTPGPG